TTWCATVVLSEPGPHTIVASGNTPLGDTGSTSVNNIFVDLTPPNPPTGLTVTQDDRQTVHITYTEPSDPGTPPRPVDKCVIKSSALAIPDAATFEALPAGTPVAGTAIGAVVNRTFLPLRLGPTGARFWAVRCYDCSGSASGVIASGPFQLDFTLGSVVEPTT